MAQLLSSAPIGLMDIIKRSISENQGLLSTSDKNKTLKDILYLLFDHIEILEFHQIQFFCGCSKKILYPVLYSLNKEELVDAYQHNKPIEMVCNVCGKK